MLAAFVEGVRGFWEGPIEEGIHGIAAIDPEFGQAVQARNQRRKMGATRVIEGIHAGRQGLEAGERERQIAILVALTSFEFFDVLAGELRSAEAAGGLVYPIVRKAVAE